MGSPKALLSDGRGTFLARIVGTLTTAGVDEVVVVTGVHHDVIAAEVGTWPGQRLVQLVRNDRPGADQLSSLRAGLDAVDRGSADAVVVALVDHPFVTPGTVQALLSRFTETGAPVIRPACRGRHGHPVVFARETFASLRSVPSTTGAKAVLQAFADRVLDVELGDEGAWTDIDTPDAYRSALARFATVGP